MTEIFVYGLFTLIGVAFGYYLGQKHRRADLKVKLEHGNLAGRGNDFLIVTVRNPQEIPNHLDSIRFGRTSDKDAEPEWLPQDLLVFRVSNYKEFTKSVEVPSYGYERFCISRKTVTDRLEKGGIVVNGLFVAEVTDGTGKKYVAFHKM